MSSKRQRENHELASLLERFAKTYVDGISVRLENSLGRASGQSDLEKNVIYISPRQQMKPDSIALGLTFAYRIGPKYRSMKLTKDEMYFLTLLHEIGHFRIKEKIPKSYGRLRRQIFELDRSPGYKQVELSYIESRVKRKNGEKLSDWKLRLADFMSWLATGETISHHMKVENWAIDEFERKRKSIGKKLRGIQMKIRR